MAQTRRLANVSTSFLSPFELGQSFLFTVEAVDLKLLSCEPLICSFLRRLVIVLRLSVHQTSSCDSRLEFSRTLFSRLDTFAFFVVPLRERPSLLRVRLPVAHHYDGKNCLNICFRGSSLSKSWDTCRHQLSSLYLLTLLQKSHQLVTVLKAGRSHLFLYLLIW